MLAKRLASAFSANDDSENEVQLPSIEKGLEKLPVASSESRQLFRERRRTQPVRTKWHDALEVLDNLLASYEEINRQISDSEEKYRLLFEDALVGIFQVAPDGRIITLNRKMATLCGYDSPKQFLSEISNVRQLIDPVQVPGWEIGVESAGIASGICVELNCRDGVKKWVSLNVRAVNECDGQVERFEGTAEDIKDLKDAAERTHALAYYDTLTGLPNRTLFNIQLDEVLATARQMNGMAVLLLFEIDRFRIINDSFGKSFGDRLLQENAERIKGCAGNGAIVARLGGGEFAVLSTDINDDSDVGTIADRITSVLSTEFSIPGHALKVYFNAGISVFPESGLEGAELLQNAEVALFASKEDGPNRIRVFTGEMNARIVDQLRLEHELRFAVAKNQLYLLYQPQVNIEKCAVTGLEALLRWQHPDLGLVPPDKFIGVAESSGLIVPIGEWVLRTACSQAKKWQDSGFEAIPIAVNVSAIQIRQQGFVELIQNVLDDTGLDPSCLELEVTESLLLTNADVILSILEELRAMGVRLAIDDFGTGYSSLSYLRQFHVNRLKIDRSFIRDVAINRDVAAITTAIIGMAKALNLEVLAEGVETEEQLSFLRAQKCCEIQGYYFSRPVSVDQIGIYLRHASTLAPDTLPIMGPSGPIEKVPGLVRTA